MKRNKKPKACGNCEECVYIGDGDSICAATYDQIVLSDHQPTDEYYWCGGKYYKEAKQ